MDKDLERLIGKIQPEKEDSWAWLFNDRGNMWMALALLTGICFLFLLSTGSLARLGAMLGLS